MIPGSRQRIEDLEAMMGRLLRLGVAASTALLVTGLLSSITGIAQRLAQGLLSAAVIILLATPAARVVISIVEYIRERDWLFVTLTMMVLLTLAGSVVAAFWK